MHWVVQLLRFTASASSHSSHRSMSSDTPVALGVGREGLVDVREFAATFELPDPGVEPLAERVDSGLQRVMFLH
jgi:hypothetical protein